MSLVHIRNVKGEADLVDEKNDFNLEAGKCIVPAGHLA